MKKGGKGKTTAAPPVQPGTTIGESEFSRILQERGDILGKLTSTIAKLVDTQTTLSEDVKVMKDIVSQAVKDMTKSLDQLKSSLPVSGAVRAIEETATTSSGVQKKALSAKEAELRESVRSYYRQSLQQFQLTHLTEDLMVEIWSTSSIMRKADFLSMYPGIEWTEALAHVVEAKTPLMVDLIKLADTEIAPYHLSKKNRHSPTVRIVYLKYTLKDLESLYTYTGYIELGQVRQGTNLEDTAIIQHVTQWMGAGSLHPGVLHQYIQYWNIPEAQKIIDFKFSTKSTYTDITSNLKIPPHQLSAKKCLVVDQEIVIQKLPSNSTLLN
jgi:uncharacterized protein YoxC